MQYLQIGAYSVELAAKGFAGVLHTSEPGVASGVDI